jgi:hypothetical protein
MGRSGFIGRKMGLGLRGGMGKGRREIGNLVVEWGRGEVGGKSP